MQGRSPGFPGGEGLAAAHMSHACAGLALTVPLPRAKVTPRHYTPLTSNDNRLQSPFRGPQQHTQSP